MTLASLIELNMEHTRMLIIVAQFLKSQLGLSSGPIDLRSCTATKATSTASGVIVYSSVMLETSMGVKFHSGISSSVLQKRFVNSDSEIEIIQNSAVYGSACCRGWI